jgi:hypothetical protein
MKRVVLAGIACVLATLACAAPASAADSATISVTTSARQADPAAGIPRVFTIGGTSARPKHLYVKFRATGGSACAPSASTDTGEVVFGSVYGTSVNGRFDHSQAYTWGLPGTFQFCMWLASSESAIATPFMQTISFRAPTGTIAALVNPSTPQVNQPAAITVLGASESPAKVFAKVRTAGAACAPSFDADPGVGMIFGDRVNGQFSLQTSVRRATPGAYQVCMWLAMSSSDAAPIAAAQARLFNVVAEPQPLAPLPKCVVPKVTRGIRLATMKRRLQAANCAPGNVRYQRSRTVARRAIVRLGAKAGSKLQSGAPVTIYVSTGRAKKS